MDFIPSLAFSILKCQYGWNGVASASLQSQLDEVAHDATCATCAAVEMAGLVFDEQGHKVFRPRLDGRPNARSVDRDRSGVAGHCLN